jgi:hypothetical protein
MHIRRIACFFLGVWFGGALLVHLLAVRNPGEAEHLMADLTTEAAARLKAVPQAQARVLLRYGWAERNRDLLVTWDTVQFFYGLAFFVFLLFGSREDKWSLAMALAMLVLAFGQRALLTPEINALQRLTDFSDAYSPDRNQVWVLRNGYFVVEALKWATGLGLVAKLVLSRGRSSDSREKVDLVDKANHRHVNR